MNGSTRYLPEFEFSRDEIGELKRDKGVVRARTLPEIGTQYLAFRLSKPDARPPTILRNELDASRLQDAPYRFEIIRDGNRSACLEISNSTLADPRFRG